MLIRMKENISAILEKRLKYRFWDKERERSNRAVGIQAGGFRPSCPTRHGRIAWSGPPHDIIQSITCLDCGNFATEPEMRDRGFNFNECPDWIFEAIMDEKVQVESLHGKRSSFAMNRR
jgi:hypothetical protein